MRKGGLGAEKGGPGILEVLAMHVRRRIAGSLDRCHRQCRRGYPLSPACGLQTVCNHPPACHCLSNRAPASASTFNLPLRSRPFSTTPVVEAHKKEVAEQEH